VDQQHPTPAGVFVFLFFSKLFYIKRNLRISNKKIAHLVNFTLEKKIQKISQFFIVQKKPGTHHHTIAEWIVGGEETLYSCPIDNHSG
jgi:hypothetical protein